jgi:hypothetical protein
MERLDLTERDVLMSALKVEAVAVATLTIKLEKGGGLKQLVGAGDYTPRATMRFLVYEKGSPDPVWADYSATGEPIGESTGHVFGIADVESLNRQGVLAAQASYEKLLARYRDEVSSHG